MVLKKHTRIIPESVEGQVIRKDKFIAQVAPDIRKKLQKLAFGPKQDLESFLETTTLFFYNHDEEERKETDRRNRQEAERGSCHGPAGNNPRGSGSWKEERGAKGLLK